MLTVGKRIFCREKTVAPEVLDIAANCGYEIINVNQGYPACTVLPLGEHHALTADEGMYRAMENCGITVRKIENGGI